jgi:hypothetical protein
MAMQKRRKKIPIPVVMKMRQKHATNPAREAVKSASIYKTQPCNAV